MTFIVLGGALNYTHSITKFIGGLVHYLCGINDERQFMLQF